MTSKQDQSPKNKLRLFFTGLTMGTADLIPGVSGGTIALLLGIYEELLYSIKLVTGQLPKLVLTGHLKEAFRIIPFAFLLPLGAGLISAIFGLSQIVSFLLDTQPILLWALFFGLVLGSSYVVSKRVTSWTTKRALLLALGFILTFMLVGLPSIGGSESQVAIFLTGSAAITAMILPGISGSLIMVLLGQYEIVIDAVSSRNIPVLAIFAAGALAGIAVFVRLLSWLLRHYHLAVIAFLVGVMAGSLRRVWPWQHTGDSGEPLNYLPSLEPIVFAALLLMVVGFLAVFLLERTGIAKEHDDINTEDFKEEFEEIEDQTD